MNTASVLPMEVYLWFHTQSISSFLGGYKTKAVTAIIFPMGSSATTTKILGIF